MPFVASIEGSFAYGRGNVPYAIEQSTLQIWLDAANVNSYSGSGSRWSNLVAGKSNYNYTLFNTPSVSTVTYNSTSNVSLRFNGTNQYASPSTTLLTVAQSNNWAETREYWVYWGGVNGSLTIETGTQAPDISWYDTQCSFSNTNLLYSVWQSGPQVAYNVYSSLTSNTWNHIVWQHNKATNTLMAYVNGVRTYSNASVARTTPDSAGSQFFIILCAGSATNFGISSYLNCALGIFRWYNTILTSNQIFSNFSVERGRFGR